MRINSFSLSIPISIVQNNQWLAQGREISFDRVERKKEKKKKSLLYNLFDDNKYNLFWLNILLRKFDS